MRLPIRLYSISPFGLIAISLFVLLTGCSQKNEQDNPEVRALLKRADSLQISGDGESALKIMRDLRPKLSGNQLQLSAWYAQISEHYTNVFDQKKAYADSAFTFFDNKENIDKYPDDYYRALLSKGDVCLGSGKYVTALDYFDQARKILPRTNICDDGYLSTRTGIIYYGQKNFKPAARLWLDAYNKLAQCPGNNTAEAIFFYSQGALDNAAVSYEQTGALDSAKYLYLKDLKLFAEDAKRLKIEPAKLSAPLEVIYDNLGGLYLKLGDYTSARQYLAKCLAIPDPGNDGSRIPPLIKQAEIELNTGNLPAAYQYFARAKLLLNKFLDANMDSDIRWKRLYAGYLAKTGKTDSSYYYLDQYITQKETMDKSSITLYRLNVQRELDGIRQQRSINELSEHDKVRQVYLEGIGVTALLSIVIVYLVYRNLKKAKKTNITITLQNQQLHQTLSELERVNQNYIRIMRIMAHDLRNPLSGMIGLATVLLTENNYDDETKHMLRLIESTGMHSIEMINELLKTGLADKNEQLIKQSIDIQALVYDSVELLNFKAREKNQQIVFETDGQPLLVKLNHEKMWRVFNNLLVNAIKFSHEGGIIWANLRPDHQTVTVSITDSGVGIPPQNKDSIFEMFTPSKRPGTNGEQPFGLGLSISKRIIEMHGGKIWFDSEVGKGSTFYVQLPL